MQCAVQADREYRQLKQQHTCCQSSPVLCRERRRLAWFTCFSWTSCGSMVSTCWQARSRKNTADSFADMLQINRSFERGLFNFFFLSLTCLFSKVGAAGASLCRGVATILYERGMKADIYKAARSRRPQLVSPPITAQPRERAPHRSQKFIIDERTRGPTVVECEFVWGFFVCFFFIKWQVEWERIGKVHIQEVEIHL